ncbi:MAG: triose-phosphate isomerase [Candidatus Nomurabacteria bacterium]|jgi:triosephosphate isomerase|nr:triose-phosphate isomerase [Candidatus Nomurabacteria bacterium]
MRKKMVVANWKMNFNVPESLVHFDKIALLAEDYDGVDVVVCPTFLALFGLWVRSKGRVKLGAQDCNSKDAGALTGEVSAAMLENVAEYVIVGHSERRKFFHETDAEVNRKVIASLKHGLKPIICIGETLNDKQEQRTDQVIRSQLDGALLAVQPDVVINTTIAYEPVWAIGSGQTPTATDLAKVIEIIHSQFDFMYGGDFQPSVLYGGSVDDNNVENFLAVEGVDGFLVGGASLNSKKFDTIIRKVKESGV